MSLKVILTLVVAFLVACFSIFNTGLIAINIGVKTVSLPISFLVFFVFIAGAVYAAILSFQMQIDQALTIRKLKKKVQELKNALMEEQETHTAVPEVTSNRNEKAPVAELITLPNARSSTSQKKTNDAQKETAKGGEVDLASLSADEEDETGLPAQFKEIALRRIQNG